MIRRVLRDLFMSRAEIVEREVALVGLMERIAWLETMLEAERAVRAHRIGVVTAERDEARAETQRAIDAAAIFVSATFEDPGGIDHGECE